MKIFFFDIDIFTITSAYRSNPLDADVKAVSSLAADVKDGYSRS